MTTRILYLNLKLWKKKIILKDKLLQTFKTFTCKTKLFSSNGTHYKSDNQTLIPLHPKPLEYKPHHKEVDTFLGFLLGGGGGGGGSNFLQLFLPMLNNSTCPFPIPISVLQRKYCMPVSREASFMNYLKGTIQRELRPLVWSSIEPTRATYKGLAFVLFAELFEFFFFPAVNQTPGSHFFRTENLTLIIDKGWLEWWTNWRSKILLDCLFNGKVLVYASILKCSRNQCFQH